MNPEKTSITLPTKIPQTFKPYWKLCTLNLRVGSVMTVSAIFDHSVLRTIMILCLFWQMTRLSKAWIKLDTCRQGRWSSLWWCFLCGQVRHWRQLKRNVLSILISSWTSVMTVYIYWEKLCLQTSPHKWFNFERDESEKERADHNLSWIC